MVDDAPARGTRSLSDIYERCNIAVYEPVDFGAAKKDQNWMAAMKEELSMIEKNRTWELVDRPQDRKVIGVKWVYRTKLNADGSINKHKARLVVKGYAQIFGVDYSDTFAPVARLDTIRILLAVAAQMNWKVYQLDVKSAFLNGVLHEEIYVEQPEGFVKNEEKDKVYLLKKAIYGLKQAPRAWYNKIDDHLLSIGFKKSLSEATLYVKHQSNEVLMISLYVDDLLVTGNNAGMIQEFKQEMMKVFEMTDLGLMTFFLGLEIKQAEYEVFICQKKYVKEILKKFKFQECKEVSTPMNQKEKLCKEDGADKADEGYFRSLIGCLMYLTATRPDILNAVSILSRFMHNASELHLRAAKRIIRYVKGTSDFGVKFTWSKEFKLVGFSDSDWGGSIDDMRSTSGYYFTLGSSVFSWSSKKQETVAQFTAEAEFIAATAAVNQALWLRKILMDLNLEQKESTKIFVDNQAAISISHNPVFHGKTKHFNIKLFFLREVQKEGLVTLVYCKSENQLADLLTKPLPVSRFEFLREKIGVCSS